MKRKERHIITVPVVFDWVKSYSSAKILIPLSPVNPSILKGDSIYFYALADGVKRVFTDEDAIIEYGIGEILDPSQVSFISIFVNGILQSPVNYVIKKGQILFDTEDVPEKDVYITIQFISIFNTPINQ
jgi:hypothetical protein